MEYRMEEEIFKYEMEDFERFKIWKISIPFHSIACSAYGKNMILDFR